MDYRRSSPHASTPTPSLILRDVGLLILRLGTAATLVTFHGWKESIAGWNHFWHQQPWPYLESLTKLGLPVPQAVAVVTVLIVVLCSLGIFFGAVARLSAALLLGLAVAALVYNFADPAAEKYWLYAMITLVLTLSGPGCLSLAGLLERR